MKDPLFVSNIFYLEAAEQVGRCNHLRLHGFEIKTEVVAVMYTF